MAQSTGTVLAAGAIAAANEAIFAPAAGTGQPFSQFNWRLIPATAVLALMLGGLEKLSPQFAKGLAGLALLSVLVIQVGNSPSPLQNVAKTLGVKS